MIYLLTAIGLPPGGSSTVHIYTQTVHRTTQNKQYIEQHNNLGECGPCPVLYRFTLAFALQLRKKHGKTSVRVAAPNYVILFLYTKISRQSGYFMLFLLHHEFWYFYIIIYLHHFVTRVI